MKSKNDEIPTECSSCKKLFDLKEDLSEEDMNKTIGQILNEKFPNGLLCPECRR